MPSPPKPWLWVALLVTACNNGLGLPGDGADASTKSGCESINDAVACSARTDCHAQLMCSGCEAVGTFTGCLRSDDPRATSCAPPPCEPQACSQFTDAAKCDARPDCHAVWSGDQLCDHLGCENHFLTCREGMPMCAKGDPAGCDPGPCQNVAPMCVPGTQLIFDGQVCCPSECGSSKKCGLGGI